MTLYAQVLDLDDPVADQHGYVYEKQAILDHISRGRGGSAKCPVAGMPTYEAIRRFPVVDDPQVPLPLARLC